MIEYNNNYYMNNSISNCFMKMVDANVDPYYLFNALSYFKKPLIGKGELIYLNIVMMDLCEQIMNGKNIKYVEELVLLYKKNIDILNLVQMFLGANKANKFNLLCFVFFKKCFTITQNDITNFINIFYRGVYYNSTLNYMINCGFHIMRHNNPGFIKHTNRLFI